ncbi:NUDIX domain-containing protein [Actinophytocola xinjiangensis]|uniref:NUDIX domain-containing protein n=1 Tax=Actinophytocola xinjiangensis TaxID=485602 RepID=UPI000A5A65D5|nr:NUDIX hydrolase [Actinophytocola xinjiangensis]
MAELELLPHDEYVRQLPQKRMSAGVVIRDASGRVLLVEPSYKAGWEIPGGVVEDDEAPWVTAVRETREEIGLVRDVGRLLVVDHVPAESDSLPERMAFLFDAGTIDPADVGRLTFGAEIVSAALCEPSEVRAKVAPVLADRLTAALHALAAGGTALCVRGKPTG